MSWVGFENYQLVVFLILSGNYEYFGKSFIRAEVVDYEIRDRDVLEFLVGKAPPGTFRFLSDILKSDFTREDLGGIFTRVSHSILQMRMV